MSVSLLRGTGVRVTYQQTFLAGLAARLAAAEQAFVEYGGAAFWRDSASLLLVVDTDVPSNRLLLELYELVFDNDRLHGLAFRRDGAAYNVVDAVRAVGRIIPDSPTLDDLNMARWLAGGGDVYLSASNLTADQGIFGVRPASLKTLNVGAGLILEVGTNSVTLTSTSASAVSLLEGLTRAIVSGRVRWTFAGDVFADNLMSRSELGQTFVRYEVRAAAGAVPAHTATLISGFGIVASASDTAVLLDNPTSFGFLAEAAVLGLQTSGVVCRNLTVESQTNMTAPTLNFYKPPAAGLDARAQISLTPSNLQLRT